MIARRFRCERCEFEVVLTLARGAKVEHLCLRPKWTDDQFEPLVPGEAVA